MSVLLRERRGATEIITINRPKALNAIDASVIDALDAAIDDLVADDHVRCVIVTGSGEKAFVAGADIEAMFRLPAVDAEAFAARGQRVLDRLARLHCPVIAAVNGFALGGGCELAMACDLIFAASTARFGQPEVKLGVIPGFGGTQRLVRRVGMSVALDLCLTGRMVQADEALRIGLVSRVVEGDEVISAAEAVLAEAVRVGEEIAGLGPLAVRYCKRAMHENANADLSGAQAAERTLFALCFASDDQKEGMKAFLEKRAPDFRGR